MQRIDKWLWAARFYKTRSLAAQACDLGRVSQAGNSLKPARTIKPGDVVLIRNDIGDFTVEVLGLSEVRGPAAQAQTLYRETDVSREQRAQVAAERKSMMHPESGREGRPTKQDRRKIARLRGF
jgi:ribosome-associated heat shock protein Hsp15